MYGVLLLQVEKYRQRLGLLAAGRLVEAMSVQTGGSSATAKAVDTMQDAGGEDPAVMCRRLKQSSGIHA